MMVPTTNQLLKITHIRNISMINTTAKNLWFSTARCYVTLPSPNDYDYICRLQSDPEVMHFFGGARNKDQIEKSIKMTTDHYKKHGLGYGLAFSKENNNFIGRCGLNKREFDDDSLDIELGVFILKESSWYTNVPSQSPAQSLWFST